MSIPNRLLQELGNAAARYNQRINEHSVGCCAVCRRVVNDFMVAMMDALNWEPAPLSHQVDQLRSQVDEMQEKMRQAAIPRSAPSSVPFPAGPLPLSDEDLFPPPQTNLHPPREDE